MDKAPIELITHNKNLNKFKQDLANLKETLPIHLEYLETMAKIVRAKYTSLLGQGFTREEALELCKGILSP